MGIPCKLNIIIIDTLLLDEITGPTDRSHAHTLDKPRNLCFRVNLAESREETTKNKIFVRFFKEPITAAPKGLLRNPRGEIPVLLSDKTTTS